MYSSNEVKPLVLHLSNFIKFFVNDSRKYCKHTFITNNNNGLINLNHIVKKVILNKNIYVKIEIFWGVKSCGQIMG